jgi:hypothetical protein
MIVGTKDKDVSNVVIVVEGAEIKPGNTFELLGVTFDQKFTVRPYLAKLTKEARFRAGRVARLAQHLPRGQLLRQLGSVLLMGKLAHCLSLIALPRLPGWTKQIREALESLQVAVNDVARSVVSCKRGDHTMVRSLLDSAGYLSVNQLMVKSTAMAAWGAFMSGDGETGTRNPVGRLLFDSDLVNTATRATAAGEVRVQTRGVKMFVTHELQIWNSCAELRDAPTKAKANKAASTLARNSQL